jgi:hypothetical protein
MTDPSSGSVSQRLMQPYMKLFIIYLINGYCAVLPFFSLDLL